MRAEKATEKRADSIFLCLSRDPFVAEDKIDCGCASPRPVDDQELLPHEEAVGDDRWCATGYHELGEGAQQMCWEDEQVFRGEIV